jgi:CRP-like cAMP-binding protein
MLILWQTRPLRRVGCEEGYVARRQASEADDVTFKSQIKSHHRSQMVDVFSVVLLAASFFFVVLAFALLVRYRQLSERINASTDLGRDLWASLEQRLKKQDERILDMMARVEVIQSRALATAAPQSSVVVAMPTAAPKAPSPDNPSHVAQVNEQPLQQPESQVRHPSSEVTLDETQLAALKLLHEGQKSTRQLTDLLGKSREHTARIMKDLFESGLVKRNDSSKPFVYELTDEGRKRIPGD